MERKKDAVLSPFNQHTNRFGRKKTTDIWIQINFSIRELQFDYDVFSLKKEN